MPSSRPPEKPNPDEPAGDSKSPDAVIDEILGPIDEAESAFKDLENINPSGLLKENSEPIKYKESWISATDAEKALKIALFELDEAEAVVAGESFNQRSDEYMRELTDRQDTIGERFDLLSGILEHEGTTAIDLPQIIEVVNLKIENMKGRLKLANFSESSLAGQEGLLALEDLLHFLQPLAAKEGLDKYYVYHPTFRDHLA